MAQKKLSDVSLEMAVAIRSLTTFQAKVRKLRRPKRKVKAKTRRYF